MNKYKLGNIIKKDLLKSFDNSEISKKKFSFAYLNDLCNTYPIAEFVFDHYCCYGEDTCCWQDEERCWMSGPKTTAKSINRRIYKALKRTLKHDSKYDICKRNVFVAEDKKCVVFSIPLRDICKEDIVLVFDKTCSIEEYGR